MKAIKYLAVALFCLMLYGIAFSQVPLHPAFGITQQPLVTVTLRIQSTEQARVDAMAILTTQYGLTEAEALEKLTTNGQLDLARCVEFMIHGAFNRLTPATDPPTDPQAASVYVESVRVELQHPEPTP